MRTCRRRACAVASTSSSSAASQQPSTTTQTPEELEAATIPYSMTAVNHCAKDATGSVVIPMGGDWNSLLPEMLHLCNEASRRQALMDGRETCFQPLSGEYMIERVETDDPALGYAVRDATHGWLQGFIMWTTFTTWHAPTRFKWDSLSPNAGIVHADGARRGQIKSYLRSRQVDRDGAIALALQAQPRDGDPLNEGIIWHRVAEISLLGGLGCGSLLVNLVIEELERSGDFDFIVLQATKQAVPFYESRGFVHVGAIAKYGHTKEQHLDATKAARNGVENFSAASVLSCIDGRKAPWVPYRHWTYRNQRIDAHLEASYMMACPLNKKGARAGGGKRDTAPSGAGAGAGASAAGKGASASAAAKAKGRGSLLARLKAGGKVAARSAVPPPASMRELVEGAGFQVGKKEVEIELQMRRRYNASDRCKRHAAARTDTRRNHHARGGRSHKRGEGRSGRSSGGAHRKRSASSTKTRTVLVRLKRGGERVAHGRARPALVPFYFAKREQRQKRRRLKRQRDALDLQQTLALLDGRSARVKLRAVGVVFPKRRRPTAFFTHGMWRVYRGGLLLFEEGMTAENS